MSTIDTKFRSLSKLAAECQIQIERLYHVDSNTVQREVTELIRNTMRQLEQEMEVVKQLVEVEDKEATRLAFLNRLSEYEHQFKQLQVNSRQAILRSRKRIDEQEKKNREELFGMFKRSTDKSFTEQFELKQRGLKNSQHEDAMLRASSDVTEALKRTSTLMQQELGKSAFSREMLAQSSKTLSSTHSEYQNLGSLVHISKRVITQLEASDWLDRLLLLFGLLFFCGVVFYIIKKRTWDLGISWLSWLTASRKNKYNYQPIATPVFQTTKTIIINAATETVNTLIHSDTLHRAATTATEALAPVMNKVEL
ncbi:Sec20-domain-containing protein [Mycotypha africana]|uniref:Sec20-domain-containing protein n=1 Tax=Mycotypha africana TaxID=64632 RepID=UPI00230123D8|nr:Sec20-domain-containing protein [Mycotypha africana]KAI8969284.1 Sec20-domain-containing protein [Mycotypha africana]